MSKDSVRYGRVPKKSRLKGTESSNMYDIIVPIAEAHQVHCAYTEERTRSLVRKPALFSLGEQQQLDGYPGSNLELQKLLMWQHFASMLSPSIPQVVEFAKRIPGFSDLHPDDQLACVKFGFFEVWCVYAARLAREGTLSFYDGTCLNAHQLEIIFDRDFVNQILGFMQWLNELQLSDTEIAMFSAMVLLNAERGGVSNPKSVQQLQSRVTEALQMRETRLQGLTRLLLSRLGELRALGQTHANHLCWFRQQWPHLRLPALFAEVFDIPARPAEMSR